VFVDGRDRIDTACDCDAVIGGDGIVMSIAAASIIAKVTRDRLMCALALDCPGYGFENHKGYAVPEHREALDRLGPSVHHRRFFAPVVAAGKNITRDDRTRSVRGDAARQRGFGRSLRASCFGSPRALSHMRIGKGRLARLACEWAWAFRTFHAFHLPGCRTDPCPAATGGLARGAASGSALAHPAAAALSQPARRACHRAGLRPEYQVGTDLGPPLAFWLADIAFRAAGNHVFGVYLLAQLCTIATFLTFYQLARAIVGGQQAVLAVLLTMTVVVFSSPGLEFGHWCWRARSGRCCFCIHGG